MPQAQKYLSFDSLCRYFFYDPEISCVYHLLNQTWHANPNLLALRDVIVNKRVVSEIPEKLSDIISMTMRAQDDLSPQSVAFRDDIKSLLAVAGTKVSKSVCIIPGRAIQSFLEKIPTIQDIDVKKSVLRYCRNYANTYCVSPELRLAVAKIALAQGVATTTDFSEMIPAAKTIMEKRSLVNKLCAAGQNEIQLEISGSAKNKISNIKKICATVCGTIEKMPISVGEIEEICKDFSPYKILRVVSEKRASECMHPVDANMVKSKQVKFCPVAPENNKNVKTIKQQINDFMASFKAKLKVRGL